MSDKISNKTVVVGMSGGVDSSTVAALLREQGYNVIGAIMQIWDGSIDMEVTDRHACYGPDEAEDIEEARRIADKLQIPLHVFDLSAEYSAGILDEFRSEYLQGRTPNPCVKCNVTMKFGRLWDRVLQSGLDFDYFATGHYARIEFSERYGCYLLKKAVDSKKDQTYFLHGLSSEQLARCMFPLGGYTKDYVKELSYKYGLDLADKAESQNFIAGDYSCLFKGKCESGPVLDLEGRVLGTHEGIIRYTVGQRKGLGLSGSGEPYYVIRIDAAANAVIVGRESDLYSDALQAFDVTWTAGRAPDEPLHIAAKIRYATPEAPVTVTAEEDGRARVTFDKPQRAITPGQAVVFYDGDLVIGGGKIESVE